MQNPQVPQPPQPLDPRIIPAYYRDDGISLVDLWITIARRKKLVLGVVGAVLLIGLAAALVMPKKYDYSAAIEIGGKLQWRDGVSTLETIESPDTVKSKLESAYLPDAIRKHLGEAGTTDFIPRIKVQAPKGSNTLIISSTVSEARGDVIKTIMQGAAQALIKDHDRITATDIALLQNQLSDAQRALDALSDPDARTAKIKAMEKQVEDSRTRLFLLERERTIIENDLSRLDNQEERTEKQLLELEALIKEQEQQRKKLLSSSKNTLDPTVQFLSDNLMQQLLIRQATLEERLNVRNAAERDTLHKRREENAQEFTATKALLEQRQAELASFMKELERQTRAQEDKIKSIKVALDNFLATRLVLEPAQSIEPAGPRKALILALAGFLGLFAGLFAAFIAEFRDKVLERMAEQGEESASA